jgi:hypothetical protein
MLRRRVDLGSTCHAKLFIFDDGYTVDIFERDTFVDRLITSSPISALCYMMGFHPAITRPQMACTLRVVRKLGDKVQQVILPGGILTPYVSVITSFGMMGIEDDGHCHM